MQKLRLKIRSDQSAHIADIMAQASLDVPMALLGDRYPNRRLYGLQTKPVGQMFLHHMRIATLDSAQMRRCDDGLQGYGHLASASITQRVLQPRAKRLLELLLFASCLCLLTLLNTGTRLLYNAIQFLSSRRIIALDTIFVLHEDSAFQVGANNRSLFI